MMSLGGFYVGFSSQSNQAHEFYMLLRFWRTETGCQQFYPQAGKLLIFALELDRFEEIHKVWKQAIEYGQTPSVESS